MKTHVPGLLATFLAGVALASLLMTRDTPANPGLGDAGKSASPGAGITGENGFARAKAARLGRSGDSTNSEQLSSLLSRHDSTKPGEALGQALEEILQAPEDERLPRFVLLLADLRSQGPAGARLVLDYLRTGQDVKWDRFAGRNFGDRPPLREALVQSLLDISAGNPAMTAQFAREVVPGAKSLHEVSFFATALEGAERAALLPEFESSAHRLAAQTHGFDAYGFSDVVEQLHSEALLRDLLAMAQREKWTPISQQLLKLTWRFSDDVRLDVTRQLLANEQLRQKTRDYPNTYEDLDVRQPEFREIIADSFHHTKYPDQRTSFLRSFAIQAAAEQKARLDPAATGALSRASAPWSAEQAAARLQLLDALAPDCDSAELKQYLAEARAALTTLLNPP
jgi:hypothetical protein